MVIDHIRNYNDIATFSWINFYYTKVSMAESFFPKKLLAKFFTKENFAVYVIRGDIFITATFQNSS